MNEGHRGHLGRVVNGSRAIAGSQGSATIEAEHLLLALLEDPSVKLTDALTRLPLTAEAVAEALKGEFDDALRAVGVTPPSPPRVPPKRRATRPNWGQSSKLAWERTALAAKERGARRLDDRLLLVGITRAQAGVIPRVLERLGLTTAAIEQAVG